MAFGIAAGANGNPDTKEWSQGERLQVTAQALYGYGYWGPFLLEFEEKTLSCGQEDLVRRMLCYLPYLPFQVPLLYFCVVHQHLGSKLEQLICG